MAKFCGWVPEPLDTPLPPPLHANPGAPGNLQYGPRGVDYDSSYIFYSVLQSIDQNLKHPQAGQSLSPVVYGDPRMPMDDRYYPSTQPGLLSDKQYGRIEQPNFQYHQGHSNQAARGPNFSKTYDPVGTLLENLESALKASESMLCRTQDLDVQAHAAIMQVKHLEDLLARKETQYAQEINELHLLLRAERAERYTCYSPAPVETIGI
jgi:hypothetical protein